MALPPAFTWRSAPDGSAWLNYHFGNVAYIKPLGGRYRTVIQWRGRIHEGRCASVAQGMRWINRWVLAALPHGGPANVRRWDVEFASRRKLRQSIRTDRAERMQVSPHPPGLTMAELERIVGRVDIRW